MVWTRNHQKLISLKFCVSKLFSLSLKSKLLIARSIIMNINGDLWHCLVFFSRKWFWLALNELQLRINLHVFTLCQRWKGGLEQGAFKPKSISNTLLLSTHEQCLWIIYMIAWFLIRLKKVKKKSYYPYLEYFFSRHF